MAKVTIVIPFHWMQNWQFFMNRCLASIEKQSFRNYEIVLMKVGSMPVTSNRVIEAAKGELVKILYMDDYFSHADSLKEIVDNFTPETQWLVTGCIHDRGDGVLLGYHEPRYTADLYTGNNCIGSPSVLTFRREGCLFFDDKLSWLLDCDLYKRLYDRHGLPTVIKNPNVVIGIHDGQASVLMPSEEKQKEYEYMTQKYA